MMRNERSSIRRCDARFARYTPAVGLLILGLAATLSLFAPTAGAQSEEQAVIAVATRFFDGMRTRDTARMRSTVVPSTILVIAGGGTGLQQPIPISQFIGQVGTGTGPGGDERITDPKVQIDGPLASLWAYYTYTRGGQTQIDHCGVDAFLFRKGPEGWKIFNLAGTIRTNGCTPIGK
jgi:hypothetical protein